MKRLALTGLAAAVVVLAVFFSSDSATRGEGRPAPDGGPAGAAAPGATALVDTALAEAVPDAAVPDAATQAPAERVLATDLAVRSGEAVLVRLVAAGGLPQGERAVVYVVSGVHARRDWNRYSRPKQRERARDGARLLADEEGRVWIPRGDRLLKVAAETSAHWGFVSVPPDVDSIELPLERVPVLRVRVVDSAGAPAPGVRLVATARRDRLNATTDGAGVARFLDVDELSSGWSDAPRPDAIADVRLRVAEPLAAPLELSLDGDRLPPAPVEIALPPCGSLELRLVHTDGSPWAFEDATVVLWTDAADAALGWGRYDESVVVPLDGDRGGLRWVEVGLALHARFRGDGIQSAAPFTLAGPSVLGEHAVRTYAPAGSERILVARLVDPRGGPVANERARALFVHSGARRGPIRGAPAPGEETWVSMDEAMQMPEPPRNWDELETGADGRVLIQVSERHATAEPWHLELSTADGERGAVLTIPGALALGRTELGDVVLGDVPLLLGGVVRNDAGAALRRVRIQLLAPVSSDAGPSDAERSVLLPLGLPEVQSDGKGRFAVRGWSPAAGAVVALGSRAHYADGTTSVSPVGTADAEIVLRRTGELRVRTWTDARLPAAEIAVRARPSAPNAGQPVEAKRKESERLDDGSSSARFELRGLAPVPHDVEVYLRGSGEPIKIVERVAVEPGEAVIDARLDPLDLRGAVRPRRIDVKGADGEKVAVAVAWRPAGAPADQAWYLESIHSSFGSAEILSAAPAIEVRVSAREHRSVLLESVLPDTTRTVQLERGVSVRLVVPSAPLLREPFSVRLLLDRTDEYGGLREFFGALDAEGAAALVCEPARYRVSMMVSTEQDGVAWPFGWRELEEISVQDSPVEQTLVLLPTSAELERQIAAARAEEER